MDKLIALKEHFGTRSELARQLKVSRQTVMAWEKAERIPDWRIAALERLHSKVFKGRK